MLALVDLFSLINHCFSDEVMKQKLYLFVLYLFCGEYLTINVPVGDNNLLMFTIIHDTQPQLWILPINLINILINALAHLCDFVFVDYFLFVIFVEYWLAMLFMIWHFVISCLIT